MAIRLSLRRHNRRIAALVAFVAAALALGALIAASGGAAANDPSMEVLPGTTGLKYGQTVEIKAHHLPKGSGTVAATICGLTDDAGKAIAKPTADDCAGAESIGKLAVIKSWQSDGEFDTQYTLPASKQQFGKNKRACDPTHYCALVVADANPDAPAYYIPTEIFFTDQQPPADSSTTTAPQSGSGSGSGSTVPGSTTPGNTTPGSTAPGSTAPGSTEPSSPTTTGGAGQAGPGGSGSAGGSLSLDPNNPGAHFEGNFSVTPPSGGGAPTPPAVPSPTLPPQASDALNQVCGQLAAAVTQAGGEATALTTACAAVASGNGPAQLKTILANPSLLCLAASSAWQNNPQITDACNQAAAALAPLAPVLGPIGGLLP